MRKKILTLKNLIFFMEVLFITGFVLFFVSPLSCRLTDFGIQLISSDYESPLLENYSLNSPKTARLVFSKSVSLKDLKLTPEIPLEEVKYDFSSVEEGLCFVDLSFEDCLACGKEFNLYGRAVDSMGNSLTFCLPFNGFNSNPAVLEIIEVHPKYQGETKGNGIFKNEYVLFKVNKSGNLSGLKFYSANDGEEKVYTFPSLEVKSGDLINLHLRNKGTGCINELETSLNLSTACYSKDNIRDLWIENENARLGDDFDVLMLLDSSSKKIIDAFMYAPSKSENWKKDIFSEYAESVHEAGLWLNGSSVLDAVLSDGLTATKAFVKNGRKNEKESWIIMTSTLK